jgi:DNA-binding NarL/FixJ family response regulator
VPRVTGGAAGAAPARSGRGSVVADGVAVARAAVPAVVPVVLVGALPAGVGGVRLVARPADPREAVAAVARHRPRVVLAGLGGPPAAARSVLAVVPDLVGRAPVLVVAPAPAPAAEALEAVRAGASGYLAVAGPVGPDLLAGAVRRTAAGEAVFSAGLAEVVLEGRGRPGGPPRLTAREAEVLRLVVDGLTGRQIAARLVLSPRTVENHIQNVLRRLALPNRAALVRHAVEQGLV